MTLGRTKSVVEADMLSTVRRTADINRGALARRLTHDYIQTHVRESHPEQWTAAVRHCRWHERARQPRAQLPASLERRAQPRAAGHPPQPSKRRGVARPIALGPHPELVQ